MTQAPHPTPGKPLSDGWSDWPRKTTDLRYEVHGRPEWEPPHCPFCENVIDQTCAVAVLGGEGLYLAHDACLPDEVRPTPVDQEGHSSFPKTEIPTERTDAAAVGVESLDDAARRLFAVQYPGRDYDAIGNSVKIGWLRSAHKDILRALSPSEQPEPVAWRPMDEAPQGCVTEEAGIRGASKWFIGRPSAEFRNCSPAFVVIRRRAWPHEDAWQGHGEVDYVPRYFDAWRPLYAQPSEQTGGGGERDRLASAYIAGAMSVHEYWTENPGEAPYGDPEFDEAAGDYAYSILAALSRIREGEQS